MLLGLAVLLLFEALGELLSAVFALPLPGPLLGMAGLTIALAFGKRHPIGLERASRGLLVYMPLLFIPAGVGVVELGSTAAWVIIRSRIPPRSRSRWSRWY